MLKMAGPELSDERPRTVGTNADECRMIKCTPNLLPLLRDGCKPLIMATSVEDPPGTVEPIVQQDDYQGLQGPVPNIGWYQIDASCIGEDARKLLEDWSGIPPDKINGHVDEIVGHI